MGVGDTGSKEFYSAYRHHSGASRITELMSSEGTWYSTQPELESVCRDYYAALYSTSPESAVQRGA
jgi:hypothetical protein